jgi:hypothetical protein
MKKTIAVAFCAATMILASSCASAQSYAKATIPFDFRVGSALLPSGNYVIDSSRPRTLWVRSEDGRASAFILASSASGSTRAAHRLVFHRYGSQYFLTETRRADGESEMTFGPSKLEKSVRAEEASRRNEGRTIVALK